MTTWGPMSVLHFYIAVLMVAQTLLWTHGSTYEGPSNGPAGSPDAGKVDGVVHGHRLQPDLGL